MIGTGFLPVLHEYVMYLLIHGVIRSPATFPCKSAEIVVADGVILTGLQLKVRLGFCALIFQLDNPHEKIQSVINIKRTNPRFSL